MGRKTPDARRKILRLSGTIFKSAGINADNAESTAPTPRPKVHARKTDRIKRSIFSKVIVFPTNKPAARINKIVTRFVVVTTSARAIIISRGKTCGNVKRFLFPLMADIFLIKVSVTTNQTKKPHAR